MSMRISSLLFGVIALTACNRTSSVAETLPKSDVVADKIACATGGSKDYAPDCPYEREVGDEGLTLTIHHPDGGFRRFLVTKDGHGIVVADGSEAAVVMPLGPHEVEVAVGEDHYRLPATVKGGDAPAQ
jgi:hypothetical protein